LPEISVRAVDLKFLADAIGKNFDLGFDGALVVGQALEIEPQPVVFIPTLILEQDGRAMILSNEQVGSAVVVEISRDDGARILELNFVEANVGSNVFEPIDRKSTRMNSS